MDTILFKSLFLFCVFLHDVGKMEKTPEKKIQTNL